jgi:hypothetical protein
MTLKWKKLTKSWTLPLLLASLGALIGISHLKAEMDASLVA